MNVISEIIAASNIVLVLTTIWYAKRTSQMVSIMEKSFKFEHKGIIVLDNVSTDIIIDKKNNKTGVQIKCILKNYGKSTAKIIVHSLNLRCNNKEPDGKFKEFTNTLAPMQNITIFSPVTFFTSEEFARLDSPILINLELFYKTTDDIGNSEDNLIKMNVHFFKENDTFQTRWFYDNS